jgi:hypothetical protein
MPVSSACTCLSCPDHRLRARRGDAGCGAHPSSVKGHVVLPGDVRRRSPTPGGAPLSRCYHPARLFRSRRTRGEARLPSDPRRAALPGPGARRTQPATHLCRHRLRVGRFADTVANSSRGCDAGRRVSGRKRHIAVDTTGLLLAVVVTMAGIQDRDGGLRLLALLRERFSTVALLWADGGYAGRLVVSRRPHFSGGVGLNIRVVSRGAGVADVRAGGDAEELQGVRRHFG